MALRLTTDYAKNYCNRTLILKVIVENVFFMGHSISLLYGFCDDDALLLYNMSTYLTILLACLLTYLINYFKFAHKNKKNKNWKYYTIPGANLEKKEDNIKA